MKKIILFFSLITAMPLGLQAQELNAKVVVNGTAVQNTVDLKVFKALEQGVHSVIIGKGEKLNELIQGTAGTTIQI